MVGKADEFMDVFVYHQNRLAFGLKCGHATPDLFPYHRDRAFGGFVQDQRARFCWAGKLRIAIISGASHAHIHWSGGQFEPLKWPLAGYFYLCWAQSAVRQLNYIASTSVPSSSGKTIPVIEPSDGQVFDEIQRSNAADIHTAATAAHDCFDLVWQRITAAERDRLLMRLTAS